MPSLCCMGSMPNVSVMLSAKQRAEEGGSIIAIFLPPFRDPKPLLRKRELLISPPKESTEQREESVDFDASSWNTISIAMSALPRSI
mmetsp:Transcript_5194/g.10189  ORF Transcript_5194/g.10189 Transcript_5194/m.10189 type:complete len:87 (+) Transcript_5194:2524-2784(+)